MEHDVKIRIPGSKLFLYGRLRGSLRRPVVLFVHGLTANRDHHLFFNGARVFERHGFSSLRISLYHYKPDARPLVRSTLRTHAADVDTAIRWLRRRGATKIFAVGHSWGAPSIMLSRDQGFDGVVLWDPSYGKTFDDAPLLRGTKWHVLPWGLSVLVSQRMIDHSRSLDWNGLIRRVHVPVLIAAAGNGVKKKDSRRYLRLANPPKKLVVIPGADHSFHKDGTEEKLFAETLRWLKRYA